MPNQGLLITFEGLDGSGKSTVMKQVVNNIREKTKGSELRIIQLVEPGTTKIGKDIRNILHDMKNTNFSPRAEALLYQASRAQLVDEVITPELALGSIIFMDRF